MASPDMDVIKEIPGYKVILKAILKSQIQQLVEQLAAHTEEESIILTASVSDGTLSHLGSESGKSFLEDHEDVKSQFLGFCLKFQHKKKQQQERQQQEEEQRKQMLAQQQQQQQFSPRGPGFMGRSPRMQYSPRYSPRQMMRSPGNRQEPYPVSRPMRRPPLNFGAQGRGGATQGTMRLPLGNSQVIKIEPDDPESESSQGASEVNTGQEGGGDMSAPNSSQPSSPSHTTTTPSQIKSEALEKDDDTKSNSSTSTIPNEASEMRVSDSAPQEGLSFDSDLSGLASNDPNAAKTGSEENEGQSDSMNIKVEAITESEMELEITGVEPGRNIAPPPTAGTSSQDSWAPSVQQYGIAESRGGDAQGSGPGYNPQLDSSYSTVLDSISPGVSEATVTQSQLLHGSLNTSQLLTKVSGSSGTLDCLTCSVCGKGFKNKWYLKRHFMIHTGEKPFACEICGKRFNQKVGVKSHMLTHEGIKPFPCEICGEGFTSKGALNTHLAVHFDL